MSKIENMINRRNFIFVALLICSTFLYGQDNLLHILVEELDRELVAFEEKEHPPYYIDYRVDDINSWGIQSSFGSTVSKLSLNKRFLTVNVRIGDYYRDNTHTRKRGGYGYYDFNQYLQLPLGSKKEAIAQQLWLATCNEYTKALRDYKVFLESEQTAKPQDDQTADFSKEKATVFIDSIEAVDMTNEQVEAWEKVLNNASSIFNQEPSIVSGDVSLQFSKEKKYFVSSEGSQIVQNVNRVHLAVLGEVRTSSGRILPMYKNFSAFDFDKIPSEKLLYNTVQNLVDKLKILKDAPEAEAYSGPAIFAPGVSGVFFHEIFGHRIEGHRLKKKSDSQTFKDKLNTHVLPKFINVESDPTAAAYHNEDLMGFYHFDDQGVKAQKVEVIKDGVLSAFLLDRSPLLSLPVSNGHGRASIGMKAVARQSNLIISSKETVEEEELRKKLIKECKRQKKEYGYYFKEVQGGYTFTDRNQPNSFSIKPTEVYRVYVDGRPDEMVSGVDMIGTPLTMFSEIEAVGTETALFNGYCGAESGYIAVTAVAPSLLVKKIETQKTIEIENEMPILKSPQPKKP